MRKLLAKLHRIGLVAMAAATVLASAGFAQSPADPDAVYDALLARYVKPTPERINRVDYAGWLRNADDKRALDTYVAELAARRPSTMATTT